MDILCITHADFESPGVIEFWAQDHQHHFKIERPYRGDTLSNTNRFDMLIVMGGPQSSLELDQYPYLSTEIDLIANAIAHNKKVLGFCLGAQLIGDALGAKPERSPEKEVGVYPITLTPEGVRDPLLQGLGNSFDVIHWHNDMPGLTNDSTLLASSAGCPRQIVRYKYNVYGFQCHLEIPLEGVRGMIKAAPEDLKPSMFTQSESELLAHDYQAINALMITLLDRFIRL